METAELALLIVRVSGLALGIDARQVRGLREVAASDGPPSHSDRRAVSGSDGDEQVPLIELASLLGLPATAAASRPILRVQTPAGRLDLRVDAAEDLVVVAPARLAPLPLLLRATGSSPFIRQVARLSDRLLLLLDLAEAQGGAEIGRC